MEILYFGIKISGLKQVQHFLACFLAVQHLGMDKLHKEVLFQTYSMIDINDIFSVIVLFVSLVVTLICLYYYKKTNINEYSIFAFFFFLAICFSISVTLHLFLVGFIFENNINVKPSSKLSYNVIYLISSIVPPLNHVVLVEFWHRAIRSESSNKINWYSRVVIALTFLLYIPLIWEKLFYLQINFETLKLIRSIMYFLAVFGMGLIYLELRSELKNSDFVSENFEISKFYKYWRIQIWNVLLFVFLWLLKVLFHIIDYLNNDSIIVIDELYSIALLVATFAFIIVWFIALKYPEGLLLFEYQIVQALKMYSLVKRQKLITSSIRVERIIEYLKSATWKYRDES